MGLFSNSISCVRDGEKSMGRKPLNCFFTLGFSSRAEPCFVANWNCFPEADRSLSEPVFETHVAHLSYSGQMNLTNHILYVTKWFYFSYSKLNFIGWMVDTRFTNLIIKIFYCSYKTQIWYFIHVIFIKLFIFKFIELVFIIV